MPYRGSFCPTNVFDVSRRKKLNKANNGQRLLFPENPCQNFYFEVRGYNS
jgi:hypothetical protein